MVSTQASGGTDRGADRVPKIRSDQLFATGGKELIIVHNNEQYRLRLTSNDKLILTK